MLTWKGNTFFIIEDIFTISSILVRYPVLQEIIEVINLTRRKDEQFSLLHGIYCLVCKAHWASTTCQKYVIKQSHFPHYQEEKEQ